MPAVDTVLLPLCVGLDPARRDRHRHRLARGNKGRVVQGVGLALAPVALYFSGLLRLLWNGVVAVGTWASAIIFSPAGLVRALAARLCASCSGSSAASSPGGHRRTKVKAVAKTEARPPTVARVPPPGNRPSAQAGQAGCRPVDDDMAEIEALLKSRGIE